MGGGVRCRMAQPRPESLFTRSFLFLSLADVAYFTGAGMLVTATPLFVTDQLGGGAAGVGLAFGAFSIATLVLRPWARPLERPEGASPAVAGGYRCFRGD